MRFGQIRRENEPPAKFSAWQLSSIKIMCLIYWQVFELFFEQNGTISPEKNL